MRRVASTSFTLRSAARAQRCNDDGGLGLRKPVKVKSRGRALKEMTGKSARDSKQLYAATDAGVDYSIDGDPRILMAEDAAARAQFCMAGDAAAREQFRKAEDAAARVPLEVISSLEARADQQPATRLEFCSKLPMRATAVRNAAADLKVTQYALADLVVRCDLLYLREKLSAAFADATAQTYKQRGRQHGRGSQGCSSRSLGGRGCLPTCWPFGRRDVFG